jgi:hypothetical protein
MVNIILFTYLSFYWFLNNNEDGGGAIYGEVGIGNEFLVKGCSFILCNVTNGAGGGILCNLLKNGKFIVESSDDNITKFESCRAFGGRFGGGICVYINDNIVDLKFGKGIIFNFCESGKGKNIFIQSDNNLNKFVNKQIFEYDYSNSLVEFGFELVGLEKSTRTFFELREFLCPLQKYNKSRFYFTLFSFIYIIIIIIF